MPENEFYGGTIEYIGSNAKAVYIYLASIQRCNGPGRLEVLTVINAYYGYYEILPVCQILH